MINKEIIQELSIAKKEYFFLAEENYATDLSNNLNNNRRGSTFNNLILDQIDFNSILDNNLNFEEMVQ